MVLVKSGNIDRKQKSQVCQLSWFGGYMLAQLWIMGIEGCPPHPTPMQPQEIRPWIIIRPAISLGERWLGNRHVHATKKNELPNQQRSFRIFPSDLPPKTKQKHKVGVLVLNDRTRFIYTPQLGNI